MQFRAQSARGLGRTGLDDVPGYGSVSGSGLIAHSTGQRTSDRCSPVVRTTVSTALQRFDAAAARKRVETKTGNLALEDCCGSILDRRIDRVDVIPIVAPVMARGVRVLRPAAAGRRWTLPVAGVPRPRRGHGRGGRVATDRGRLPERRRSGGAR